MTRIIRFVLLCCLLLPYSRAVAGKQKSGTVYKILSPPKPDYSPLSWLIGEWSGKIGTKSPAGDVRFSASYDLDERFIILREEVNFAGTKNAPASRESWMGVLSPQPDGKGWLLCTFSNHGFLTRYNVTQDGNNIQFAFAGGEQAPQGWLFRRVMQHLNNSEISETVEAAPPQRPFFEYYTTKLTRIPRPVNQPVSATSPGGNE